MKDLPTGIQSFEKIIKEGYIYVDKTSLMLPLIEKGGYYFLSRPRRFGKTLLLRTIRDIYQGKKELFRGLYIDSTDYKWEEHPIIYLNFAQILHQNAEELTLSLAWTLKEIAHLYQVPLEIPSPVKGLENLIKALSYKNKVVVLIDEYDKPIMDHLDNIPLGQANTTVLKPFFEMLKALDEFLKLVFITGVSNITQASLFSGLNNVTDITMTPFYASLLGYTEEEIRFSFKEHLEEVILQRNKKGIKTNEESLFEDMRCWYHGYRFSEREIYVYNPYSIMSFLSSGNFSNHWFRTGTPTPLIKKMKNQSVSLLNLHTIPYKQDWLCTIHDIEKIHPIVLMWQTGYLTIQKYDPIQDYYYLDFPNKEVRRSFFNSLLSDLSDLNPNEANVQKEICKKELQQVDLASFFKRINSFFANVPYHLSQGATEDFYHALFIFLLEAMEIKGVSEDRTSVGRIDLKIEFPTLIYIFEFKIDRQEREVSKQVERYTHLKKEIVTVGISFTSAIRKIASWEASVYTPEGEKNRYLSGSCDNTS